MKRGLTIQVSLVLIMLLAGRLSHAAEERKKSYKVRVQYRHQVIDDEISDENDLQATFFTKLSHDFFLFMNGEAVFSGADYESSNSEFNLSRPIFPSDSPFHGFDWTCRLRLETGLDEELSLGLQWHVDQIPGIVEWARENRINVFLQLYPLKTSDEQGDVDTYLYYDFPLPGGIVHTRGFARHYFTHDDEDFSMIAQDLILPVTGPLDVYVRYAWYSDESRNSGYGIGIRYLFRF